MNKMTVAAFAASFATALAVVSLPASGQDAAKGQGAAMEKCYGVALKGQNDCATSARTN